MITELTFVNLIHIDTKDSKTKEPRSFDIAHYIYKDHKGQLVTNQEFVTDPEALKAFRSMESMKKYSADIRYINKKNVFISLH